MPPRMAAAASASRRMWGLRIPRCSYAAWGRATTSGSGREAAGRALAGAALPTALRLATLASASFRVSPGR